MDAAAPQDAPGGARTFEAAVLAAALAARLGWAVLAPAELWFDHVFNDATAWNLASGHGFSASAEAPFEPAIFRTPGYPAFLAAVYAVAGHSVRAAFVVQALLDTLCCLLLGRLAARALGPRAGRWTLLLAATYPFTVHAVGTLSPETLLVLLGLLLVASVEAWPAEGAGAPPVAAAGAIYGALCWVKPVFLPLPLFLLAADRLRGRPWPRAAGRAAAAGALGLALFAPWVARNDSAFGRPLISGELGIVVWHGTRDFDAEVPAEIGQRFAASAKDPVERYEATRGGLADSKAVLAQDEEWLREGTARIRERPARAFLLDPARRVPRLWISTSHAQLPGWVGATAAVACLAYLGAALAGLWILRDRLRALAAWWVLPVLLTLAYAALHAEARYTLPARSSLLLLAGAAVAPAWSRLFPATLRRD
jgi:hypothetical protein